MANTQKRSPTAPAAPPAPAKPTSGGPTRPATAPQGAGGGYPSGGAPAVPTWRALNARLTTITEDEAWAMYEAERKGAARVQILLRLYGRANKLRAARERREMLACVN